MLNKIQEIVLASGNAHKLLELKSLLSPMRIKCISQTDLNIKDAEETGLTFIENAIIKARHASKIANKPALADDSGLVVQALNGNPGIYSARFSGVDASCEENINLLLQKMQDIPFDKRQAYFYTAIVLITHERDPAPIVATGKLSGFISTERKGTNGFGYDSVFYLTNKEYTLAQLPSETKNKISHRAQALNKLMGELQEK